jgi:hypothetical protein
MGSVNIDVMYDAEVENKSDRESLRITLDKFCYRQNLFRPSNQKKNSPPLGCCISLQKKAIYQRKKKQN